jgi:hypothetical protein
VVKSRHQTAATVMERGVRQRRVGDFRSARRKLPPAIIGNPKPGFIQRLPNTEDTGGATGHLLENHLGLGNRSAKSIAEIESTLGTTLEHWRRQRSMIRFTTRHRDQISKIATNCPKATTFRVKQCSGIRCGSTWIETSFRYVFASLDDIVTLDQCHMVAATGAVVAPYNSSWSHISTA